MIRGINRQVVEVKETGCEYFEKIMFFVKPEYAGVSEGKIRERAGMIAGNIEKPPVTKMQKDKKTELIKVICCAMFGFVMGVAAALMIK